MLSSFSLTNIISRQVNGHFPRQTKVMPVSLESTNGCSSAVSSNKRKGYCSTRTKDTDNIPNRTTFPSRCLHCIFVSSHLDFLRLTLTWEHKCQSSLSFAWIKLLLTSPTKDEVCFINIPKYNWSHSTQHISSIIILYYGDSK